MVILFSFSFVIICKMHFPPLDIVQRIDLGYAPRAFVALYGLMAIAIALSVPIAVSLFVVLYYYSRNGKLGLV